MNFFRNVKAAFNYANYDFFKLKKEIIELIKRGRKEGLSNPDYCKLTIKNSSVGHDYPVFIDLYYKTGNDEAVHLPQELLIGTFSTIPSTIKKTLFNKGYVEIRINDLAELTISANEEVNSPINFESLTNFVPNVPFISRQITIKDEIFTYRVIFKYTTADQNSKSQAITYSDIKKLPEEVVTKLVNEGSCLIQLD